MRPFSGLAAVLVALSALSCAEMQPRRYGLDDLRFKGVHDLDPLALGACLASQPREKLTLGLSALRSPSCGVPPFDKARASKRLFAWGWSDWPVYDEAIFKLDLERITRWYRARGYYQARVLDVQYDPPDAKERDESSKCPKGCKLDITVTIEEGEPIRLRKVELLGVEQLAPELQKALQKVLILEPEDVFDESVYDAAKAGLEKALREEGHAHAKVHGDVVINRAGNSADVRMTVEAGPVCQIGQVRVHTSEPVPIGPILATTLLTKGQMYRESELDDAQRAIYALGAFSAVNVRGELDNGQNEVVDVLIEVEPRRKSQVQIGAGLMSGTLTTGAAAADQFSVPQWDVHLIGSYEHRNFMGGLRRFRIEDRPRLIFLEPFPRVPDHLAFGNLISASFAQPGIFEPRTTLFVEARHDYGPDPFQLFFRNDIGVGIGLERGFWKQQIKLRGAIRQEFMLVSKHQPILQDQYPETLEVEGTDPMTGEMTGNTPAELLPPSHSDALSPPTCTVYGREDPPNMDLPTCARTYEEAVPGTYYLPFLEQRITIDLRDDPANPTYGAYFGLSVHEAVNIEPRSWSYVRVLPDLRGYVPLGLGLVLAARFALGAIYILDPDAKLDDDQQKLGPQTYRLRGGGANSNRGFLPGQLGDSTLGGIRSWESSLELRIPIFENFSIVAFGDVGDVHGSLTSKSHFRWQYPNTAFGGGLRYRTIVGPIRLDVGVRPKNLQRGPHANEEEGESDVTKLSKARFPGAIHLTIGEAF
jgi:outer membrane translocation and assembly module TamA